MKPSREATLLRARDCKPGLVIIPNHTNSAIRYQDKSVVCGTWGGQVLIRRLAARVKKSYIHPPVQTTISPDTQVITFGHTV